MSRAIHNFATELTAHLNERPGRLKESLSSHFVERSLVIVLGASQSDLQRALKSGIGPFAKCLAIHPEVEVSDSAEKSPIRGTDLLFSEALGRRTNVVISATVLDHRIFAMMAHARANGYKTILVQIELESEPSGAQCDMEQFALGVHRAKSVVLLKKDLASRFTIVAVIDKSAKA